MMSHKVIAAGGRKYMAGSTQVCYRELWRYAPVIEATKGKCLLMLTGLVIDRKHDALEYIILVHQIMAPFLLA